MKNNILGYFSLFILSKIYLFLFKLREILYRYHIFLTHKVNTPVICFGNISSGGAGKTSMVIAVARELSALGKKVAIIMRGYKKQKKRHKTIIVDNENFPIEICGDEAKLIYLALKDFNIPVIINSNRFKAALLAEERFKPDVILMDDGFQHFSLFRDMDILLINVSQNIEEEVLPLGNLREDFNGIKRANLIVLTHCESSSQSKIDKWQTLINEKKGVEIQVIESMHAPDFFLDVFNFKKQDISFFYKKDVILLSAIGDPESFEMNIKNLGANIKKNWIYEDHHNYTLNDLVSIANVRDNLPIITTYKDFMRFPDGWDKVLRQGVYVFSIKITFLSNGYRILMDKILEKIK